MHIGEREREIIVEPLELPVPVEQPSIPDTIPAEWAPPAMEPVVVPA